MTDDTDQASQSDQQLLHRQFTTVFEQLINVARFSLPFVLVLLDDMDDVLGCKVVETSDNPNAIEAINFVASEGIEEGLSYPMNMMVRDTNRCTAYVYLDDIDAQPEIRIVHVAEDE